MQLTGTGQSPARVPQTDTCLPMTQRVLVVVCLRRTRMLHPDEGHPYSDPQGPGSSAAFRPVLFDKVSTFELMLILEYVRSRASNSFTYPLFGPLFFRTSSYAQSCDNRLQVPQVGLAPSQRSFLLRHKTQAILFCLLAASSFCPSCELFCVGDCRFSFESEGWRDRSLK